MERMKKWSKSLWKLEDRWNPKLPEGFTDKVKASSPFFAQIARHKKKRDATGKKERRNSNSPHRFCMS